MENFSGYLKREIPITDYAQRLGFTLVRRGRYYSLKEHDSVIIDTAKNCFWRNSRFASGMKGSAGSVIDFCMEFGGAGSAGEALRELSNLYGIHGERDARPQYRQPPQSAREKETVRGGVEKEKEFSLPEKAKDNRAVFRYLIADRRIQRSVIRYFLGRGLLYQDVHNNCVFHTDVFGCVRSTNGQRFVGDVEGSDYDECFFIRGSKAADTLVVTESVIDLMSVMSLFTMQGKKYTDYCYLSLAGTNKLQSVFYHLGKEGAGIREVLIAVDNDRAGDIATRSILEKIGTDFPDVSAQRFPPPQEYKDWNDYIKAVTPDGD